MRKLYFIFFMLFLAFAACTVEAASLNLGTWQTTGSQVWRTSFPTAIDQSQKDGASELRYPLNGRYLNATYEKQVTADRALRIELGVMGAIKPGMGSDADWDYSRSLEPWWYGEFQSGGKSRFAAIDWVKKTGAQAETFIGYAYHRNDFRMTQGLYYWEDYQRREPPRVLADLNSTYAIAYQGPRLGWRFHSILSPKIAVIAALSFSPLAYVHGQGWWNLRDLTFEHNGPGHMLDTAIGIHYAFSPDASAAFGYRFQRFGLFRGWENTDAAISWDAATYTQKGWYLTSEMKF
ncbi:MAG: hypothetical protein N2491_06370 [Negativicutes bacterium]|nr:hypothetical protein [Negativicutes bacterium]